MSFVLVAHGTRLPRGVSLIGDLADRVAQTLDRPVHVAFVDVLGPTPAELLSATTDRTAVLVPAAVYLLFDRVLNASMPPALLDLPI